MAVSITVIDDLDRCVRATLAAIHEESATVAYAHIFDSPFPTEDTRQGGIGTRVRSPWPETATP